MDSEGLSKLLKRVNERICALRADSLDAHAEFFCECGHRDCAAPIELTPRSYLLGGDSSFSRPGTKAHEANSSCR
jgi:hypothetical protein